MSTPDPLIEAVLNSLQGGTGFKLDYNEIVKHAEYTDAKVIPATVSFAGQKNNQFSSLNNVASLFSVASIGSIIPEGILSPTSLSLDSASFYLVPADEAIIEFACVIGLGDLSWSDSRFSLSLDTIRFVWSLPGKPMSWFGATVNGTVKLGDLNLDLSISFPDPVIKLDLPPSSGVKLSDLLAPFVSVAKQVDFCEELYLTQFDFSASPLAKPTKSNPNISVPGFDSFSLSTVLETEPQPVPKKPNTFVQLPVDLIPGILTLDMISFDLSHNTGNTNGTLDGQLLCKEKLALYTVASLDTGNGSWTFNGSINIPTTWNNLNPDAKTVPSPYVVTLTDLITIFGFELGVLSTATVLSDLGISTLSITYTHASSKAANSTYTFNGVFEEHWSLDDTGDIPPAELTIALGSEQNHIAAEFDMDGFKFDLSYDFAQSGSAIAIDISKAIDGKEFKLSGSYKANPLVNKKPQGGIATLGFCADVDLATLLSWVVGEVTQNRYFRLPDPWHGILQGISISTTPDTSNACGCKSETSLSINTKTKTVSCTHTFDKTFFGITLSSITIGYNPTNKTKGASGITIAVAGSSPAGDFAHNWDPITKQAPKVPGHGGSVFQLELAAVGQHFELLNDAGTGSPSSVSDAMTDLASGMTSWAAGQMKPTAKNLRYAKQAGWLIGAHANVLGQADVQLIFNDPEFYGLSIAITNTSPKKTKLNALVGLNVEILYRKLSATLGEYEGKLTLPNKIANINYGSVKMHLPSIAASIYTNGDFSFDIGFPNNFDFSHSFSALVREKDISFSGAGGFYYKKLNGLDPASLPQIDATKGIFDPVTELGLGFRVGFERGFSSGPLSAHISLVIEGLFQGVFAKCNAYAPQDVGGQQLQEQEYYAVDATLEIIGRAVGSVDFAIITASLSVTIDLRAHLQLTAERISQANIVANLSAEITVSINLGLFSIHVHCHFSTTFSDQISFGSNSTALWDVISPATMVGLEAPVALMATAPITSSKLTLGWQPILARTPIEVYFLPQATAGMDSASQVSWYYVGQLGLNNPQSGDSSPAYYADFVKGLLRWALYAINNKTTSPSKPVATADVNKKEIAYADVQNFLDAFGNKAIVESIAPKLSDLQGFFKYGFQTSVVAPPILSGKQTHSTVGFFPKIPGMSFSLGTSASSLTTIQEAASIKNADTIAEPGTLSEQLFNQYIQLVFRSIMKTVLDSSDIFPQKANSPDITIETILSKLSDAELSSVAGMTTRFLLNGGRVDNHTQALYEATGQQVALKQSDIAADNLYMQLSLPADQGSLWGISCGQGNDGTLTVASVKTPDCDQPILFPPKTSFAKPPSISALKFVVSPLDIHATRPQEFHLKTSINAQLPLATQKGNSAELWRFPLSLQKTLAETTVPLNSFGLHNASSNEQGHLTATDSTIDFSWVLTIDLKIKRILLPTEPGKGVKYLKQVYALGNMNQEALLLVDALFSDVSTTSTGPITAIELAYSKQEGSANRELVLYPFDFEHIFLTQSNFCNQRKATQVAGGVTQSNLDPATVYDFIEKLQASSITTDGNTYLYFDSQDKTDLDLPTTLFNSAGEATVSLLIHLGEVKSYTTGVRTTSLPASPNLYVSSSQLTKTKATIEPGNVGVQVSCTYPAKTAAPGAELQDSLLSLYSIVTGQVTTINSKPVSTASSPVLISPRKDTENQDTLFFEHVFQYIKSFKYSSGSTPPPSEQNPYQDIGQDIDFDFYPTDLFGNQFPKLVNPVTPIKIGFFDPVFSLNNLPYLKLNYAVVPVPNKPTLRIYFDYHPPEEVLDASHLARSLEQYARAIYQCETNLSATVTTSLLKKDGNPVAIAVDISTIKTNLISIYQALAESKKQLTLTEFNIPVLPTDSNFNVTFLYPLTVSLSLQRQQADILPAFSALTEVLGSTITLIPRTAGSDATTSLQDFSQLFEMAYSQQGLKLAVGPLSEPEKLTRSQQIWVVSYTEPGKQATGLEISFSSESGKTSYYAPRPLSNQLLSKNAVTIKVFDPTKKESAQTATKQISASHIDIDAVMNYFLKELDALFSPELLIPAELVNQTAMQTISNTRQMIIDNLLYYVTDLTDQTSQSFNPTTDLDPNGKAVTAIGAAAEKYRQACQIELDNFYKMSSVVVFTPVITFNSASMPVEAGKMNFLGEAVESTMDKKKPDSEFSLTSGTAALTNSDSFMAFGLYAKKPSEFKDYEATLDFQLSALEHNIQEIKINDTRYETGSWLKFVEPLTASIPMGTVTIPIPLRSFPAAPVLNKQYASSVFTEQSTLTANEQLQWAKSWALNGSYSAEYAAQDEFYLTPQINCDVLFEQGQAGQDTTLFEALVSFQAIFPQIEAILNTKAAPLSSILTTEQAAKASTELSNALDWFAALTTAIATALNQRHQSSNSNLLSEATAQSSALPKQASEYILWEGVDPTGKSTDWIATMIQSKVISGYEEIGIYPVLEIPGYTTEPGPSVAKGVAYQFKNSTSGGLLQEQEGWKLKDRIVSVQPLQTAAEKPLDILFAQSGLLSMRIRRNADLPPPFHYQTAEVSYKENLLPHLRTQVPIEIAALGTSGGTAQNRTLSQHLLGLFHELLKGEGQQQQNFPTGTFQAVVYFEYQLNEQSFELSPVAFPITLRLSTEVEYGNPPTMTADPIPSYITSLEKSINDWLATSGFSQTSDPDLWKNASLAFHISLFSSSTSNGQPLLSLENLTLSCQYISTS